MCVYIVSNSVYYDNWIFGDMYNETTQLLMISIILKLPSSFCCYSDFFTLYFPFFFGSMLIDLETLGI